MPTLRTGVFILASVVPASMQQQRGASAVQSGLSPCHSLVVNTPTPLRVGDDGKHIAQFPVVASDERNKVVMGNDFLYDGNPIHPRSLTVWSVEGRDLKRPAGDFTFAFPRGIMRGGVLHLLWAEPSDDARTTDMYLWPGSLTSIWAAEYSQSQGWTTPRRVYSGTINTGPGFSPTVGSAARASLVEFGSTPQKDHSAIITLRYVEDDWRVMLIPAGRTALYPSVVEDGTTIMAVFVDAYIGDGYDDNSIFFVRSRDDGQTWSRPLLLSRSGHRGAFDTQLHLDRNHQLHLIWRRVESSSDDAGGRPFSPGAGRDVLGHMLSPDLGRAWTAAQELALPGPAYRARTGIDSCGLVHVFYRDLSRGGDKLDVGHAIWNGSWSSPALVLDKWDAADLTVHQDLRGALSLVFRGRERPATPSQRTSPFRMLLSRLE